MAQQAVIFEKQITKTVRLPYLLSLPIGYDQKAQQRWPLILFLHGAGERGNNDMKALRRHGIPKLADTWNRPFITVSPQCPPDSWWQMHMDALMALLDDVVARYAVDTRRVYLTGISMGAFGAWYLAALMPRRFAAVVPICGGWPLAPFTRDMVTVLKDTPIWVFHGAKDPIVPLEESQALVERLRKVGGKVRFTVYPEAGHDSWTQTYDNPELYDWLLQQHL